MRLDITIAEVMTPSMMYGDTIALGVLYEAPETEFTSQLAVLQDGPLVDRAYDKDLVNALLESV